MRQFVRFGFQIIATLLLAITLVACSNTRNHPSDATIENRLRFELPDFLELKSYKSIVTENFGSEVSPEIRGRFSGAVQLTEPLYKRVERLGSNDVIEQISKSDHELRYSGRFVAVPEGEQWNVEFYDLVISPEMTGQPLSAWSLGSYVFKGSEDANELRQRIADEAERGIRTREKQKRIALEEQKRTEQLERQMAAEQAAFEREQKEKRKVEELAQKKVMVERQREAERESERQRLSFRQSLAGTWESITPLTERGGRIFRSKIAGWCDIESAIKFRLEIPDGSYDNTVAAITVYNEPTPALTGTVEANVSSDYRDQTMTLSYTDVPLNCTYNTGTGSIFKNRGNQWSGKVVGGEVTLKTRGNLTITLRKT